MPHTWAVQTGSTYGRGVRDTPADAWDAAHAVVADALATRKLLDPFTIYVDGIPSVIRPANSGDVEADAAATLEMMAAGRQALVDAHRAAE